MEGRVYLCSWTTLEHGYKIVLSNRPSVSTTAGDVPEAGGELLYWSIGELFGDGEPNLEYDRPPPRAGLQERYLGPDIVKVVTPRRFAVEEPDSPFPARSMFGMWGKYFRANGRTAFLRAGSARMRGCSVNHVRCCAKSWLG